jgi:hypothetical protein
MNKLTPIVVVIWMDSGVAAAKLSGQALAQALSGFPGAAPLAASLAGALSAAIPARQADRQTGAQQLIAAMETQLDSAFERQVEQCLRHLSQYLWLGQSALAAELGMAGANRLETGKALRRLLVSAIESLRPAGARPAGTQCVPREWQGYIILHAVYVEDVPNRNIMSRLFISEGTFNRRRREALHAAACVLMEVKRSNLARAPHPLPARRTMTSLPGNGAPAGWPRGHAASD